jgi:hypothetical protein
VILEWFLCHGISASLFKSAYKYLGIHMNQFLPVRIHPLIKLAFLLDEEIFELNKENADYHGN